MQRYGDFELNTNIWLFSSFVCCDRVDDLRQRGGKAFDFVLKKFKIKNLGDIAWWSAHLFVSLHPVKRKSTYWEKRISVLIEI